MIDEKDVAYIIKMLDIGFAVLHHFKCCTVDKWMILQYDNMRKNIWFLLSIKIFSSQRKRVKPLTIWMSQIRKIYKIQFFDSFL